MSRLDLVASLLRSTARGAAGKLKELPAASALQSALRNAALGRTLVPSSQLTAALAHAIDATQVTAKGGPDVLRIDAALADGSRLAVQLRIASAIFAAGGAKELTLEADPPAASRARGCSEAAGAIAGELARALWKPALVRAPESGPADYVGRDGDRLVVDLRSVPEVRWALRQRLPATLIELLRPRRVAFTPAGLELQIAFDPRR